MNIAGLSESYLKNNLMALALRSPELCNRLQHLADKPTFQLQETASGHPNVLLQERGGLPLHSPIDPVKEAEKEVEGLQSGYERPVFCLGVGLGYYLEALLKHSNPCQPIFAYERNPWLLYLTLMRSDFRRDILAGRLRFLSAPDLLRSRPQDRQGFSLWPHPVLGPVYGWERTLLTSIAVRKGFYRRALVMTGGLFALDVSEALQAKGLEAISWQPTSSDQQQIIEEILSSDPHLIVAINYKHGLPEISSTLGIPLLVWEIDPSFEKLAPQRTANPYTYIYTYRKSNVARFREAGFEHVEYLPLAANPNRRRPMDLSDQEIRKFGADVSFVGSSMADQAEVLRQLYAQLTQIGRFSAKPNSPVRDYAHLWELALEAQNQNPDHYTVEEIFQQHLLPGSWLTHDGGQRLVDLAVCVGETAAYRRRAQALGTLSHLGDSLKIRVWGDDGWRGILPDTVQWCGPVGHFFELTTVYNATRINLDINRIYQRDITTMRVFDVLACQGFLLADYSDDLGELFDLKNEVIAYRSLAEIAPLVTHFLKHPDECRQIAMAGHQRVLKEHTIQLRVESMLDNLP